MCAAVPAVPAVPRVGRCRVRGTALLVYTSVCVSNITQFIFTKSLHIHARTRAHFNSNSRPRLARFTRAGGKRRPCELQQVIDRCRARLAHRDLARSRARPEPLHEVLHLGRRRQPLDHLHRRMLPHLRAHAHPAPLVGVGCSHGAGRHWWVATAASTLATEVPGRPHRTGSCGSVRRAAF